MKLKPCPLCGGKAIGYWHTVYGEKIYCIECKDCELSFTGIKKKKAEEDWNKRAYEEDGFETMVQAGIKNFKDISKEFGIKFK